VELLGGDGELDRRLRALPGRVPQLDQGGGQDAVAGIALDLEQGLAHLRGEGGDVDQPDDVIGVGGGVGDHGAAVGVADGNDRAGDLRNRAGDIRRVVGDTAQRVGGGDDRDAGGEEALDDAVPTGGVGEGAVDEDDGRGGAGGGGGVGHGGPFLLGCRGRWRPDEAASHCRRAGGDTRDHGASVHHQPILSFSNRGVIPGCRVPGPGGPPVRPALACRPAETPGQSPL
jgi:hypothetical protein